MRALVLLIAILVFSGCNSGKDERRGPKPASVTIRVQADVPVVIRGSMNGFIHSLSATEPTDTSVAPLAPRLWRSDLLRAPADRARALGAEYQFVLSDQWGYPPTGWSGRGPPWADLGRWERFVRRLAREHAGEAISWDIWNEPDNAAFWKGGRHRFFEVYAVANRALRDELGPGAPIVGPSTSRYSREWFSGFFERCLAAACQIDFLAWHENLRPFDPLDSISAHLTDARSRFLADPRLAPVGLREIHINEYVGAEDRYLPGETVAYLAQLERGGADRAARSCWTDADCAAPALDGLLSPADGSPRAIWWAHRWYADGAESRVMSDSSDPAMAVLASAPAPGRVQVLLGQVTPRPAPASPPPKPETTRLELTGLPRGSRHSVRVERVPSAGEATVVSPDVLEQREATADGGALILDLPSIGPHEAMLVTVEAPAG